MLNILLNTDSYKLSHFMQYPIDTQFVNSYIEPRKGKQIVHFGLQMLLKEYLSKPFTKADIDEAAEIAALHGEPFNKEGFEAMLNSYGGYMPLYIESLPEGTVTPSSTAVVQIRNTDERFPWLPGFVETLLLRGVWYPSSVATVSHEAREVILGHLNKTCMDPLGQIDFKLHDFGARGCTSTEQSMIGGLAHLINFRGTDTLAALIAARKYYNATDIAGNSIPAAEHSTIMSWDLEVAAYNNMVDKFGGPDRMYAVVSDTYDIRNAVDFIWGYQLVNKVKATGGTLVVRPDSGDPVQITQYVMESLANSFGFTVNQKGYKVLDPSVRVIQGDGVDLNSIDAILKNLDACGFSAENIAFGMGAGLLQKVNRDTYSYAMKASAIMRDNKWKAISKNPVTDSGKKSKAGRLSVKNINGKMMTISNLSETAPFDKDTLLVPVFNNGEILKTWNLTEVRNRVANK